MCIKDMLCRFISFIKELYGNSGSRVILKRLDILNENMLTLNSSLDQMNRNIYYVMSVIAKFTKFPEEQNDKTEEVNLEPIKTEDNPNV